MRERNIICALFIIAGFVILCGNDEASANEVIERMCVSGVFFVNALLIWLASKSNEKAK